MPGDATRRIVVDGTAYVWRRRHTHDRGAPAVAKCSEVLTIYREGHKRYPLHIQFNNSGGWLTGYPQAGVLTRIKDGATYNLNRPAVVAALIRWLLARGWSPDEPLDTDILGEGYSLLGNAGAPREPAAGTPPADAPCAGTESS
jgi:hypothetical protein